MECFIIFVALVIVFTVLVVMVALFQTRADRHNQAYFQIAQRFNGVCHPAGWFSRGSVRFRYGATNAVLYTYSGGSAGASTLIQLEWPDPRTQLEVFPLRQASANPDLRVTAVGSEAFDRWFGVRAADSREARSWLSEGVRWQIDRLRHFALPQDVQISVFNGRLLVRMQGHLRRFDQLEEYCRLALELYDQAMLTRSVGIEFVDGGVQPILEAICQVCGENIETEMVFCRRCKTPHHADCWQYYGSCSTYGCRETVFITPRLAGPATDSGSIPKHPR